MPPEQQSVSFAQVTAVPVTSPQTPQVKYAGFWLRLLALNLDILIVFVTYVIVIFLLPEWQGKDDFFLGALPFLLIFFLVCFSIVLTNSNQGTLGKRMLGLRVVSENGNRLPFGKICFRETLGKFVSFITFGAGFLMVGITSKKQALHDKMAGSVVLSDSVERSMGAVVLSIFALIPASGFAWIFGYIFWASLHGGFL